MPIASCPSRSKAWTGRTETETEGSEAEASARNSGTKLATAAVAEAAVDDRARASAGLRCCRPARLIRGGWWLLALGAFAPAGVGAHARTDARASSDAILVFVVEKDCRRLESRCVQKRRIHL